MQKITSRDNQKLKLARKVRDARGGDLIFVEGARLADEALRSALLIEEIFFTESFNESERGKAFLQDAQKNRSNLNQLPEKIFDSLSDTKNSQGIVLLARKPETGKSVIESGFLKNRRLLLLIMLHRVNNPANLGAILRTAEAVDAAGIIITRNSADAFSPKALRGAMGASFRLPLWTNADFEEALDWAREKNFTSACADVNAGKGYLEIDWKKPRLLVFGSEAHGLDANERAQIDESLLIPMENEVESLNLAVACGVILFEAKRQAAKH